MPPIDLYQFPVRRPLGQLEGGGVEPSSRVVWPERAEQMLEPRLMLPEEALVALEQQQQESVGASGSFMPTDSIASQLAAYLRAVYPNIDLSRAALVTSADYDMSVDAVNNNGKNNNNNMNNNNVRTNSSSGLRKLVFWSTGDNSAFDQWSASNLFNKSTNLLSPNHLMHLLVVLAAILCAWLAMKLATRRQRQRLSKHELLAEQQQQQQQEKMGDEKEKPRKGLLKRYLDGAHDSYRSLWTGRSSNMCGSLMSSHQSAIIIGEHSANKQQAPECAQNSLRSANLVVNSKHSSSDSIESTNGSTGTLLANGAHSDSHAASGEPKNLDLLTERLLSLLSGMRWPQQTPPPSAADALVGNEQQANIKKVSWCQSAATS